jgi:putative salt-induced outer membrane protein YdiY
MTRLIIAALAAAVAVPLLGDQVVFDNGDRVTGKVTKKDGDSVTIESELMGAVTIKWARVKSIVTDDPVTVELSGKTVQGKIATSGDQMQVGGESAPLPQVTTVRNAAEEEKYRRLQHPRLRDLWAGYYDFGIANASGNSRSLSVTNALNAARITKNDKISLYFTQLYSKGLVDKTVGVTAQSWKGGWKFDRDIIPRLFVMVFDDYEKDRFQNLDFRGVFGGGLGFHAVKTPNSTLDLVGGFSFNHEDYSVVIAPPSTATTRNSGEIFWGDDYTYKVWKSTVFNQTFRMFNNLNNAGEYRVNMDVGLATKIAKWLSLQLTASDRYISNPAPGRKTNDLVIASGIRVTFSQVPQ